MNKFDFDDLAPQRALEARCELVEKAYTRTPLCLDREVAAALSQMSAHAWNLARDQAYGDGARFRSLNRYKARIVDGAIEVSPSQNSPYFQSSKYNSTLGGQARNYAPLAADLAYTPGVHRLIAQLAARLPLSQPGQSYNVNLHLMRFSASPGMPCDTSPPGFHKDGEKYISVVLLAYCGADGGRVSIRDNERNDQASFTMRELGECYIIDDEFVWHKLSPVKVNGYSSFAFRDLMLFDFIPEGWQPTY